MMHSIPIGLLVAAGGGTGAWLRWLFAGWLEAHSVSGAWPIVLVNLAGCALIGMLAALLDTGFLGTTGKSLFVTGMLGGFTTFSSFGLDMFRLLRSGAFGQWFLVAGTSVMGGLLLVFLGYQITSLLLPARPTL